MRSRIRRISTGWTGDDTPVGIGRMLAFSDGVFAIAFTLLVLDLVVPPGLSEHELRAALTDLVPDLFSALLGFAVIGRFWISHHELFEHLRVVNRIVLVLNTVLMVPIAMIPFTTRLLAEYGGTRIAVIIYSATVAATAAAYLAMWLVATRRRGPVPDLDRALVWRGTAGFGGVLVGFTVAIPVAWVSTVAAQLCWLIAAVPTDGIATRLARRRAGGS